MRPGSEKIVRAERLRLALALTSGAPELPPDELLRHARGALTSGDLALMASTTEEDLALVNACLEVEQEVRQHAYAVLGRLLSVLPAGESVAQKRPLDERILELPDYAFAAAATCLLELGWVTQTHS